MVTYMDNAATTKPSDAVRDIMNEVLDRNYGNPSSIHKKGFQAEKYVSDARESIAKTLKVEPKEIYFTSGGTESNNLALFGTAFANKRSGIHIITTCFEHASVYNPLIYLESFGFKVSYLKVDKYGHININELLNLINDETILVSIMMVNNEVGATQDIEAIAKAIKDKKKDILFHVDAIQAYGKYIIYPKRMGIDLLSISGHKIHGPKGSGVLFVRDKVKIKPIIWGGGQEKDLRSGTENVPAIAGLGVAAKEIYTDHKEKIENLYRLKKLFVKKVLEIEGNIVNAIDIGDNYSEEEFDKAIRNTAPHVISVSFKNIRSEVMLHSLESKGVYVSSGSACSSNHPQISGTLKAIGVADELLDCTIRFSFSVTTEEKDIDYAIDKLKELVPILQKYRRK